jgi:hypothetical protein
MIQTICPNATFRDGQRGELGAPDANGFASFVSITGARFTVLVYECLLDGDDAVNTIKRDKHWKDWPTGCLTFCMTGSASGKSFLVLRTPTAAQCNAKRSAANQARLADAERKLAQREQS